MPLCRRLLFTGIGSSSSTAGVPVALIRAEVQESSPSIALMGGKLVFATTPHGSIVPVDRVTIDNQVRGWVLGTCL